MTKTATGLFSVLLLCLLSACRKADPGTTPVPATPSGPTTTPTTTMLSITDFNPKLAKPATDITITGTGFGTDRAGVKVAIGASPYDPPVSVTPTTIIIKTNLATPSGKISVIVNGNKVTSTTDFTALPEDPKIVGFDTSNGQLGHQMYLYANGMAQLSEKDTNKIFLSFGGTTAVKANYLGPARLAIGAVVPRYARAGKITLTIDGKSAVSDIDFPLHASMSGFSPAIAARGDTLKITGAGFTTPADMGILFNALYGTVASFARPIRVTPTEMWVIVPNAAQTGYLEVSAAYGTITDTYYEQKFQVR